MKRKFTFFGICVLLCTLMISLGSCQKDYSEDIDDLQNQINTNKTAIAALNGAIASGKLIKTVSAVTGGYQITFSDNTTVTVNHGTNGTNGTNGAPGTPGAPGANGFTPIVGIDAAGYWTVITTQGGTPVRIKNAGGNDVMAEFSKDLGMDAAGMLTVGGVSTTVAIPMIVYNSVTKQLTVTVKDENGVLVAKTIAVSEDTFLATDLTSVNAPIGETRTIISYSQVPADNAAGWAAITGIVGATKAQAQTILTWAGTTFSGKLKSGGSLPVMLNPSGVKVADYTFEVIKQDGSLFALQPNAVVAGFAGSFAAWAPGTSTNLYSLNFDPGLAALTPLAGSTTNQLAVRAVKDGREVLSGYQYSVRVQAEVTTTFAPKVTTTIIGGVPTAYYPIGTSKNILSYFDRTAPAPVQTLINLDFFKSVIEKQAASINSDINPYITYDGTTVGTGTPTLTTITNVSDKTMNFDLRTFDWVGSYKVTPVDILFYGQLKTATVPTLAAINHELTAAATPADQKVTSVTPMFDALQIEGKTELWRNQATNVEVTFAKVATPTIVDALTGVTVEFLDATNTVILGDAGTAARPIINTLAKVKDIRHIRLTFDETVVNPGAYVASLKFADRRGYANNSTDLMVVKFNVTITEPTAAIDAIILKMKEHKAGLFDATTGKLVVFGTVPTVGTQLVQLSNPDYYNLSEAYVHLNTPAVVPAGTWAFTKKAPATTAAIPNPMTGIQQFDVTNLTMYNEYTVTLSYSHFGNPNMKKSVEDISVTGKSAIQEGSVAYIVPPVASGLPSTLQVLNGDLGTTRLISDYVVAKDYLGNNLNAFVGAKDTRAVTVNVINAALDGSITYKHFVDVTLTGAVWSVKATNSVALLTADVEVPLTVEIIDQFGKKLRKEIKILVKKNA